VGGWDDDHVRVNDRFYKGGNTFRGFETAGIGPRDLNYGRSDSLGGKAYAIGKVELMIPTGLPEQYGIKAAVFTDFGTLGLLDDVDKMSVPGVIDPLIKDDLSLRASAGLSIFWRSPMGPIRLDFSQVLAKEDYDKTETFKFSTSTRF
jgi:outer membrane protein insertion porin family